MAGGSTINSRWVRGCRQRTATRRKCSSPHHCGVCALPLQRPRRRLWQLEGVSARGLALPPGDTAAGAYFVLWTLLQEESAGAPFFEGPQWLASYRSEAVSVGRCRLCQSRALVSKSLTVPDWPLSPQAWGTANPDWMPNAEEGACAAGGGGAAAAPGSSVLVTLHAVPGGLEAGEPPLTRPAVFPASSAPRMSWPKVMASGSRELLNGLGDGQQAGAHGAASEPDEPGSAPSLAIAYL